MIVIDPNKITGKQAIKVIEIAMKLRREQTGKLPTWTEFYAASQLSKAHVIRFKKGRKPGVISLHKIAAALESWGNKVEVKKFKLNIKYRN